MKIVTDYRLYHPDTVTVRQECRTMQRLYTADEVREAEILACATFTHALVCDYYTLRQARNIVTGSGDDMETFKDMVAFVARAFEVAGVTGPMCAGDGATQDGAEHITLTLAEHYDSMVWASAIVLYRLAHSRGIMPLIKAKIKGINQTMEGVEALMSLARDRLGAVLPDPRQRQ